MASQKNISTTENTALNIPVEGIELDKAQLNLTSGGEVQLNATVSPSNASSKGVSWESSDSGVVEVSNGKITAKAIGNAVITAKTEGKDKDGNHISATCEVSVYDSKISISLGDTVTLKKNEKKTFDFIGLPDGYSINESTYTYSLSGIVEAKTDIANGNATNTITAKSVGETTITANITAKKTEEKDKKETETYYATCKVIVLDNSRINEESITLKVDETIALNTKDGLFLTIDDTPLIKENTAKNEKTNTVSSSSDENTVKVEWKSSNENIVKVSADGAKLIPTGVGTTIVTASSSSPKGDGKCAVTVLPPFYLNKSVTTFLLGGEEMLNATLNLSGSNTGEVNWNNDNPSCVKIEETSDTYTKVIRGTATGTAKITASCQITDSSDTSLKISYSESCEVTVVSNLKEAIIKYVDNIIPQAEEQNNKGYSLDITFRTSTETDKPKEESKTLNLGVDKQFAIDEKAISVMLSSVRLHKEMYKPGCLELVLETTASLKDFSGIVTLKYQKDDNQQDTVASAYYIFEKKKKGGYVTLKAYSVDKFLTIDKFSQAFTGKLLVDEIIEGTLANSTEKPYFQKFCSHITSLDPSTKNPCVNPNKQWKYTISNLQHLTIDQKASTRYKFLDGKKTLISKIEEEDSEKVTEYNEVEPVLPYNVQFEESFYDFLVRVCNRNGEFLYVEDNKLHIGIPGEQSAKDIYEYESNGSATGYEIEYTEEEESCDYTTISNRTEFPAEYYKPIREKDDDFAKKEDYYIPGAISLNLIKPIVESAHILDSLAPTAMACGGIFGVSELFKKQANDGFKKNFGDYTKGDVYQFVDGNSFGNGFYADILKNEKLVEQKKLIVTSSTYKHHQLGDTVKVDNTPYVVYQVRGGAKIIDGVIESQDIKRYKEEFEMLLIPYIRTEKENSTEITYSPYPIPLPRKNTIKPSTQRAKVSANNDPMRLGRVRVLFDWQDSKDSENASPWINIASPMASENSGFMFLPAKDDAVLVDFVDGNVENPYVVGAFYMDGRTPSYHAATQNGSLVKSITSANGHHLTFTDLPGSKFGANLFPFSYFAKFGFLDGWSTTGDDNKLGGGFELADYYGFYSITGSTHDRKVSIKSPFGDVSIDAFQGITISAPSGNIKIEGKNVDIIARNNLSITSGTNIANPRFYSNSAAGYNEADKSDPNNSWNVTDFFLLKHLLQPMAGAAMKMTIDLSLYRTWFESIFRPIGGTMLIKSHRFMRLEAGKGQTAINSSKGFKTVSKKQTAKNIISSPFKALGNYAFDDKTSIMPDNVWTRIIAVQGKIVNAYNEYMNLYTKWLELKNAIENKYGDNRTNDDKENYLRDIKGLSNNGDNTQLELKNKYLDLENIKIRIDTLITPDSGIQHDNLPEDGRTLKNVCDDWTQKINTWLEGFNISENGELKNDQAPPINEPIRQDVQKKCHACVYLNIKDIWGANTNAFKDLVKIDEWINIAAADNATQNITFDEKTLKGKITISHWYDHKHALRLMGVAAGGMGLTGIIDDRSWSKKDTGNILLSAEAGKMYRFGADGSFKAYMPDEANAWRAFIIKMIRGAKLAANEV